MEKSAFFREAREDLDGPLSGVARDARSLRVAARTIWANLGIETGRRLRGARADVRRLFVPGAQGADRAR